MAWLSPLLPIYARSKENAVKKASRKRKDIASIKPLQFSRVSAHEIKCCMLQQHPWRRFRGRPSIVQITSENISTNISRKQQRLQDWWLFEVHGTNPLWPLSNPKYIGVFPVVTMSYNPCVAYYPQGLETDCHFISFGDSKVKRNLKGHSRCCSLNFFTYDDDGIPPGRVGSKWWDPWRWCNRERRWHHLVSCWYLQKCSKRAFCHQWWLKDENAQLLASPIT